jgi:hypothetical protein
LLNKPLLLEIITAKESGWSSIWWYVRIVENSYA